jgi:hypothetical protein
LLERAKALLAIGSNKLDAMKLGGKRQDVLANSCVEE